MVVKGQMINERYQIIRLIGEGGMANVYLAHDIILDRMVAVKILRGDLADDEKFVRRFQREAISASSLTHPNIVGMYDVGEDNGDYFIVMEYIDGKTLKSLIKKRGALTLPEVMDIMLQLLDGVKCAHDSYIIHRDIKPQNVLILDDGTVKITDFGIATALNNNELTQTNSVMGSVHYLPPEQANGKNSTVKSDIYSIGIMMYELLTGKLPFKGDNAVEIAIKQMRDEIPSVCLINPEIPQSIENIILKACAKNPKNRYDSAADMQEDLRTALDIERKNEPRYVYKYDEQDLDETKEFALETREELNKNIHQVVDDNMCDDMQDKKDGKQKGLNITLFLVVIVFGLIALFIIGAVIIYPKLSEVPDVKIPDVSELTRDEAVKKLEDLGLKVYDSDVVETSDEIDEGLVIGTKPSATNVIKKGNSVTLIISSGESGYIVKDYKGKNCYEVQAELKLQDVYVLIEKKDISDIEDKENLDPFQIIDQSVEPNKKLNKNDKIILYIPDIVTEYPDFVEERWTEDKVREFCEENGIILSVDYQETTEYIKGTVLEQSRAKGTKVVSGMPLKIKVAKEPTPTTTTTLPTTSSTTTTTTTTTKVEE
ncbi:MAG: Stk1 family PASTA domain-containing Ser/Thr kinase [Bacilli bacterium]|nr:Stk1 family PASTA domain-containing Ser/Thr kinase [Bacilli bacterium]